MQSHPRWRSLAALLFAALAGMFVLAGCSSDSESASADTDAPASGSAFPITFENADGTTTEIEKKPERILSTSVSITGTLLAIDAPVVASSTDGKGNFFKQWAEVAEEKDIQKTWPAGGFDVEAVIAADPDLIVVSTTGADSVLDSVDELKSIGVPVIVLDYSKQTWEELALQLGEATGLEEQAQATVDEFNSYVEAAAGKITVPEGEANIVSYNGPGSENPIGLPSGPHAKVLSELGFTIESPDPAWHTQAQPRSDFVFSAYEHLTELTADTTFVLSVDNAGAAGFTSDPVLANLPSVKSGQVYGLGPNSFRIDYFSAMEIVDGVVENFAK